MDTRFDEDDTARALIERRWFALDRAVGRMQEECADLGLSLRAAQDAWHRARSQLCLFEALRDAVGEELARQDASRPVPSPRPRRSIGSAA